ncbi:DedA family protein [Pseudarthrobacter phenanthrenivorans]|uniref:DedA family protein n=1 Tax=Pseudarthrobacter phenanthrenivorans TaxID=361575 RepID=A0A3B0FR74_PSEPS|nr:DedA family protein [Pseudarthrobacter phenanthrenivorans]RKO22340.1 DedA family protein [Pseudarthrobacter phenanthrenivorans]
MWGMAGDAAGSTDNLTGLVGVAARAIEQLGEWGVGAFTLAETVLPPIPSEVILPLAGYLAKQGSLNLVLVFVTSTLGAYLGALFLYWLGARLGLERSIRGLSKLPLVDRDDFERAAAWFRRHGRSSIFFGRLLPGIRSLISLPAGASGMPLGTFSLYTLAGSGLWNGALIGLGYLLGTQYRLIEEYSRFLNYAVYGALAVTVALLVARRLKRQKVSS